MAQIPLFTSAGLTPSRWWRESKDGDAIGLGMYERHYSARKYQDGRLRRLFVGPGEKVVLIAHDDLALFVWRRFIDRSGQPGVNCAVFRNESPELSSVLIRDAEQFAWARWPHESRLYTYVAASHVRSSNPGWCFICAGWTSAGWTKGGHGRVALRILERVR